MERKVLLQRLLVVIGFLVLACIQIFALPRDKPEQGDWFLYGRDTVSHDAIVYLWLQEVWEDSPTELPLWNYQIQGGIPVLGAFLYTPLAPPSWTYFFFDFPLAQLLSWAIALAIAGVCGYTLGRSEQLDKCPAFFCGLIWMVCGHVVTLIHAGHFQKVMALGWLPLIPAGFLFIVNTPRQTTKGILCGSLGLGMTFLCGHPQIAYAGLLAAFILWLSAMIFHEENRKCWKPLLCISPIVIIIGMLISSLQLLPGLEMAAVSNRGGGIGIEEAVKTSYPPGEIAEFAVPRYKGTSVTGFEYTGDWGERIVSDFIGPFVIILSLFALFAIRDRARSLITWMALLILFLVIGLGKYTPLYGFLYRFLPGFSSFRSPGTFMCICSLALAVTSSLGLQFLMGRISKKGYPQAAIFAVSSILAYGTISHANRHFLIAEPWRNFQRYILPNEVDLYLVEESLVAATYNGVSPQSLRGILHGQRALYGYHPVYFEVKQEAEQGLEQSEWFALWGLSTIIQYAPPQTDTSLIERTKFFPRAGQTVYTVYPDSTFPEAQLGDIDIDQSEWNPLRGSHLPVNFEASSDGTVSLPLVFTDGHSLWNEEVPDKVITIDEPVVGASLDVVEGENTLVVTYEPASYRIGTYLTSIGFLILAFLVGSFRWIDGRFMAFFPRSK